MPDPFLPCGLTEHGPEINGEPERDEYDRTDCERGAEEQAERDLDHDRAMGCV